MNREELLSARRTLVTTKERLEEEKRGAEDRLYQARQSRKYGGPGLPDEEYQRLRSLVLDRKDRIEAVCQFIKETDAELEKPIAEPFGRAWSWVEPPLAQQTGCHVRLPIGLYSAILRRLEETGSQTLRCDVISEAVHL